MPLPPPAMEIDREIRFAVVMYGGVSLAIYINGVAQELFQLARATATDPAAAHKPLHHSLSGTASIYRRLAQLLSMEPSARNKLEEDIATNPRVLEKALTPDDPIHVKFVIDTISGTSAGGINGVFLGKALARNEDIDQLRRLWIEEGDILKLINDEQSVADLGCFPKPDKPAALLNGQRMYRKLVEALDGMDPKLHSEKPVPSGYVEDLDVFVTTTDVTGLPVFFRLCDEIVREYRYKNVFQFQHRQNKFDVDRDDFGYANNPLLAFAARCTSSFPVAFEPMRLENIGEVLETIDERHNQKTLGSNGNPWAEFFPLYRRTADLSPGESDPEWYSFWKRPFCDGGYLDNKPFSYAIDMLATRVPRLPGERKLVYIEPDPQHPERQHGPGVQPNALENAVRAMTMASYETIREDLDRVLDRNRLVERVDRLLEGSDEDVGKWQKCSYFASTSKDEFLTGDIDSMIRRYGPAYGGYHRLKVGDLTDEISKYLGAALDFDLRSAHVEGLKLLVRAWREATFVRRYDPRNKAGSTETENNFLDNFDLLYRIRRLRFTLRRIDALKALKTRPTEAEENLRKLLENAGIDAPEKGAPWELEPILAVLNDLGDKLRTELTNLVKLRNALLSPKKTNPLAPVSALAAVTRELLQGLLSQRTDKERLDAAKKAIGQGGLTSDMDMIADFINSCVKNCCDAAKEACKRAFGSAPVSSVWSRRVVELTKHYYEYFQGYDFVSFPLLYATDVGEEIATTEVIRISPDDATTLVNPENGDGRKKLAGTAFSHFGAFFEESWRKNDMLWGRLDGAERLIKSLLPLDCPNLADALVKDAQRIILEEHYQPISDAAVLGFASDIIGKFPKPNEDTKNLDAAIRQKLEAVVKEGRWNAALIEATVRHYLGPENLRKFFASPNGYKVDPKLTASTTAHGLARATTVVGKVLDGIGDQYSSKGTKTLATWLVRFGRAFWGLVEIATPKSLPKLLGRHLIRIFYLFEVFLILGGSVLAHPDAAKLGWVMLVLTIAVNFVWWVISDWLSGKKDAAFTAKVLAGLLLAGLALFGAYRVTTDVAAVRQYLCSTAGFNCEIEPTTVERGR